MLLFWVTPLITLILLSSSGGVFSWITPDNATAAAADVSYLVRLNQVVNEERGDWVDSCLLTWLLFGNSLVYYAFYLILIR